MKKQTADWTRTPEGDAKYRSARDEAQRRADASGCDVGIERNDLLREFRVFGLPRRENRCGHELRCEVVHCSDPDKAQPGHGYAPRRVQ